jgi:hypothetical protein
MRDEHSDERRFRVVVRVVLLLAAIVFVLQAAVVRPRLWPAGPGLVISGGTTLASLGEARAFAALRPPDVRSAAGRPATIARVWPGGPADRAGVRPGMIVTAVRGPSGQTIDLAQGIPSDSFATLRLWRESWFLGPNQPVSLDLIDAAGQPKTVTLDRLRVSDTDQATWWAWLREHAGRLVELGAFLLGAAVLVVLGVSGKTAALTTLALIVPPLADAGPLLGAERAYGVLGSALLVVTWIATPLAFPIIGTALLFFPRPPATLTGPRALAIPFMFAAALPMLVIGLAAATFLLGADWVLPMLAWGAERPWVFPASFAISMVGNVLVAAEGLRRYRRNPDADERRRIQIVVMTGVPAVFAYAVKIGLPALLYAFTGRPVALPWSMSVLLQLIVLLPAFGLPYAVAVRRVLSPRTVLRRSMQYALAQKTLAALTVVPAIALTASLVGQRDRSLASIVSGRPGFYVISIVVIAFSLRYRYRAERWLDQKFFRAEYDAREILLSLARRVPHETDPRALVSLVLGQIDSALHPDRAIVLVDNGKTFEAVGSEGPRPPPLQSDAGLITLLRWSDKPLEVVVDDPRSSVSRLPATDRQWLTDSGTALLVPIVTGTGDPRPLVGVVVLGPKQSEERYTSEDRSLLAGIADQMGVALDLSRLRREAISSGRAAPGMDPSAAATMWAGRGVEIGDLIDGKYRVEATIGAGGMGAVYRARDLRLDRDVAIKIVRRELIASPEAQERFQREARLVARLQHPCVITVFDYGVLPDGGAYLVMEYIRGEVLRDRLQRQRVMSTRAWADILGGIAAGVEAAHGDGILHRDLKPENILLPESGTGPKVLDFGIAKATAAGDGTLTASGTVMGTPAYMAPEQLRGERLDARTDVYSLGVMTYEALTGALPFGGGTFVDVAMRQANARAQVETAGLSPAVADVVLGAIAYERDERPATPAAFADAIRRAIGA